MADDRWDTLRGQHERDQRKESDRRLDALEDQNERERERSHRGYSGNGIHRFLWILVAGLVSLFLGGVVAGIVMYREIGEMQATMKDHQGWLDYLKQKDRDRR